MPQLVGEQFSKPPPKFDFVALGVTDGRVYLFRKGTDYDSSEANFRLHLARYSEENGVAYESRAIKDRDGQVTGMEVRFVDPRMPVPADAAGEEAGDQESGAVEEEVPLPAETEEGSAGTAPSPARPVEAANAGTSPWTSVQRP